MEDEIITIFKDEKIIYFSASRYRLKIVINNLHKPFLILFQGFSSDFCNDDYKILNKIPNYMEGTFSKNINYNYIYVVDFYQLWGLLDTDNIYIKY